MTEWIVVITITILATISPGPDFAMVSRNALTLSRRAGILTALGIGAGVLVHVFYTLVGIGLLIRETPALFAGLKFAGAAYLIWLGIKMLRTRKSEEVTQNVPAALTNFAALRIGFFTNALNPKTMIFIVSLFLQIIQPETPVTTRIAYGLFIAGAHVLWFSLVGLFFSASRIRQSIFAVRHWIDWSFGVLIIGFGVTIAMMNLGA